ncbi:RNA-directed DNA polymerase from mobile element jockey-like, partial [Plakobranchus ocellatus]
FGYENADAVGQWLVDLTGSSNLTSLVTERSDPTFLHSKGGQYRPDVALVSSDLVETVRREVLEEVGSDHLPSLISISSPSTARTKISAKWCFKKANWEVFRKTLDRTLEGKDMDNISIDVANDFFARAVIEAARRGVPRGVVRQYIPKITQELALAIKRRREARRTYVKNPLPINKKRYNALCRRARKVGQATKIKAWHDTCEKLDTNSDPRRTWNMIRVLEGKRTTARVEPLEYKGSLMQTDRKEAEAFSHYYAKTSKVKRTPKHDNKVRKQRQEWERKPTVSAQTFTVEFTRTELDAALEKGTNGKAPGLDGVTQEMLTNISLNAKEVLLKLLNRTWTSGVLPRAWRTAVLVPMLKKGKNAKTTSSYRPISLTSVICKTIERMVNARLVHYLERNSYLDEAQAGFRKNMTTTDQLVRFTQSVIDAWQSRQHTVAVFIDLEKAYDKIWRTGLFVKLQKLGVTGRMYNWIRSFLENRYIRTRVRGTLSSSRPVSEGLPQGSALSCTLFLCYVNDLQQNMASETRLAYADDLVLWQHSSDVEHAADALNKDLALLKQYCAHWKMSINTTKTVYSVFSNSNPVLARDLDIKMGKVSLQRDNLPKYLGVSLDPRLNLTKHVKNVASNVRERIGIVKKVAGTSWGAKPHTLRTLYTSFVRPVLEYANPILNLASQKSLETLDRVQNAALRLITGGLQSTPISVLEAATGCEPLGLRREVQTVKTLEKYLRMEAGSTLKGMAENYNAQKRRLQKESVLSAAYKYAPKFRLSSDRAPLPTPCWAPEEAPAPPEIRADIGWLGKKSDAIPSALKALALEKVSSLDSSYAICYTDGSAENGIGKGGYGVLYQWPDGTTTREAGSVGSICCSYDCEYKALLECLKGTIRRHREVGPLPGVAILTDCQALLHNLKRAGSAEVGEAMRLIDELQRLEKVRVVIQWVPSHIGLAGNETADSLAREGTAHTQLQNPTTYGQVVQSLGRKLVTLWRAASNFNDDTRCQKFYDAFSAKDYNKNSDRVDAVQLFRIRAGHSLLGSDMARSNWSVSTDCRLCGKYENSAHVLLECPELGDVRPIGFSNLSLQDAIWGSPENARTSARLLRTFFRRAL